MSSPTLDPGECPRWRRLSGSRQVAWRAALIVRRGRGPNTRRPNLSKPKNGSRLTEWRRAPTRRNSVTMCRKTGAFRVAHPAALFLQRGLPWKIRGSSADERRQRPGHAEFELCADPARLDTAGIGFVHHRWATWLRDLWTRARQLPSDRNNGDADEQRGHVSGRERYAPNCEPYATHDRASRNARVK
jgi:hypothetical protein